MSPYLYSIDQMPRDFSSVHKTGRRNWAKRPSMARTPKFDFSKMSETAPLLADTRFLLAAVAVPIGAATVSLAGSRKRSRADRLTPRRLPGTLDRAMPAQPGEPAAGLRIRVVCCRMRISSIAASQTVACGRTAFARQSVISRPHSKPPRRTCAPSSPASAKSVSMNIASPSPSAAATKWCTASSGRCSVAKTTTRSRRRGRKWKACCNECKVGEITRLTGLFAPEFCEDCGAPLFADADSEMVHPELPEEAETTVGALSLKARHGER